MLEVLPEVAEKSMALPHQVSMKISKQQEFKVLDQTDMQMFVCYKMFLKSFNAHSEILSHDHVRLLLAMAICLIVLQIYACVIKQ